MNIAMPSQSEFWAGGFGDEYTEREHYTPRQFDAIWETAVGTPRSKMYKDFIGSLDRNIKILEVGANYGLQLQLLQEMGFKNLYGLEINKSAIELAHKDVHDIYIMQGDALDLPFKDNSFDLVFTSCFLIHIAPANRKQVMSEIRRVSKQYVLGYEFFAKEETEINYRGNTNVLWKTDFRALYQRNFPDLELIKEEIYSKGTRTDGMFLLKK